METKTKIQKNSALRQVWQVFLLAVLMVVLAGALRLIEMAFTNDEVIAQETSQSITSLLNQGHVGYRANLPLPKNRGAEDGEVLGVEFTSAAIIPIWQATKADQLSPTIRLLPGQSMTFWVDFVNSGSATWYNSGNNFVALNVDGPAGRQSVFCHTFWTAHYRPAKMAQGGVGAGETARFRFAVTAPEQPGVYQEKFHLVAEDLLWIPGGNFTINISVLEPPPVWQAELQSVSFEEILITPGGAFTFEANFINTGTATWYNSGDNFLALNVTGPPGRQSPFRHDFWPSYYRPNKMTTAEVKPGESGQFRFAMRAPDLPGFYLEEFNLVAENLIWLDGGYLSIPITVNNPILPVDINPDQQNIRVGLFDSADPMEITANKNFLVKDDQGKLIASLAGGKIVTVSYQNNRYKIVLPDSTKYSANPVVFSSNKSATIFEIISFTNATAWNSEINDNRFRNILEINHSEVTDKTWAINELPLELYLRGVAESGNDNPDDYLKALIIAERTYAQYHIDTGTKHADENYTVDATYDQVYRGYGFEERAHKVVEMIEATEGQMVTYDGEIVVTPYFSQTDGRTRSWQEVWSGEPKPWLVSVPDPACEGLEMLGHGVGMSAYGAREMAEDGSTYEEILKYYYQTIEIQDYY